MHGAKNAHIHTPLQSRYVQVSCQLYISLLHPVLAGGRWDLWLLMKCTAIPWTESGKWLSAYYSIFIILFDLQCIQCKFMRDFSIIFNLRVIS